MLAPDDTLSSVPKKLKSTAKKIKHRITASHKYMLSFKAVLLITILICLFTFSLKNYFSQISVLAANFDADLINSIKPAAPLKVTIAPVITSTPTPTPTPTEVPTPTAVPRPAGYCLRVPVLMYHHIQPEEQARVLGQKALTVDNGIFDQQMAYLAANGYTTVFANELTNALVTHSGLPGKPIVITMDDGYVDNDTFALPVLQKYNLKANIMLATGLVGSNADMLTWDQVGQMKGSGLFYFTNHTWSHYPITRGPQDKIETEIDTAQTQIHDHTGQTVNLFTYPYGSFNDNAIATLQRKGYQGAFSEIPGQYQCDSFIMTLHRTRIGNAPLSYYGI